MLKTKFVNATGGFKLKPGSPPGGGALPYMGYIGRCRGIGYGSLEVLDP